MISWLFFVARKEDFRNETIEKFQTTNASFLENVSENTVLFTALEPRKNHKNQPVLAERRFYENRINKTSERYRYLFQ